MTIDFQLIFTKTTHYSQCFFDLWQNDGKMQKINEIGIFPRNPNSKDLEQA